MSNESVMEQGENSFTIFSYTIRRSSIYFAFKFLVFAAIVVCCGYLFYLSTFDLEKYVQNEKVKCYEQYKRYKKCCGNEAFETCCNQEPGDYQGPDVQEFNAGNT